MAPSSPQHPDPPGAWPPGGPAAPGDGGGSPAFPPPGSAPGQPGAPPPSSGFDPPGPPTYPPGPAGGFGPAAAPYPPAQPGYPPVPPAPAGPPLDPFAIAGFISSLLCLAPVAIILCVVALIRIARSKARGRGLAVAGIVISVLSIALTVGAVVLILSRTADRDPSGQVTEAGMAASEDLQTGDCLAELPSGFTAGVQVVPCAQPHGAQVVSTFDLTGSRFPGDDQVQLQAQQGCQDQLDDTVLQRLADGELTLAFLHPTALSWSSDDRQVICLLGDALAPTTETFPAS